MFCKVYTLGEKILFWPEKNMLHIKGNMREATQLTKPASRCLELLLQKGELVTQAELYEYGWEGSGFSPSPNTLYQCISVLRKAFRRLDESETIYIVTVPRKGFSFNKDISFRIDELEFPCDENDDYHRSNHSAETSTSATSLFLGAIKKRRKHLIILIFTLLYILLVVYEISFLFPLLNIRKVNYFSDYKENTLLTKEHCKFFTPTQDQYILTENSDISFLSCKKKPFNYIIQTAYSANLSIISCNKKIDMEPDFCSVMHIMGNYEK